LTSRRLEDDVLNAVRTTLTLDDDVAAALQRSQKARKLGLKAALNELLRNRKRAAAFTASRTFGYAFAVMTMTSCAATMVGFPHYAKRELAEKVSADLGAIEAAIGASKGEHQDSLRAFVGPVLSLAHSRLTSFHGYRLVGSRDVRSLPALLYPRLTWPHVAEPRADGTYYVPLLLTKEAFVSEVDPVEDLVFRLEARIDDWETGRKIDRREVKPDRVCRPDAVAFRFATGDPGSFPDLHEDAIPLLLVFRREAVQTELLYDLRILPRVHYEGDAGKLKRALDAGDWIGAANAAGTSSAAELRAAGQAVSRAEHPLFARTLTEIVSGCRRSALSRPAALEQLARRMRDLETSRFCDAPVWFDTGEDKSGPFHFIAAADLQLHKDAAAASRFFALLEACPDGTRDDLESRLGRPATRRLRATMTDDQIRALLDGFGVKTIKEIAGARFAILVGDCVDGAGGQAQVQYVLNFMLGLPGPESPFEGGELDVFTWLLRHCSKPVFAVPGNHDGGAGYPGVLNWPFDGLGWLLNLVSDDAALVCRQISRVVPGLVRPSLFGIVPARYDGLEEWQYWCGPTNLFFQFRAWQFLCINSFHLDAGHRATVGGVALNSGGGLQHEDVAWAEIALRWFGRLGGASAAGQLVFMHHDPRGAQPVDGRDREERFGIYETIDTPLAVATFGYLGLFSYATLNGIYLPLVSAGLEYSYRGLVGVRGPLAREWMRRWFWDRSAYGARELISAFNTHLGKAHTERRGGIRAFFFAHNNAAMESRWLRDEESRLLFRGPDEPPWKSTPVKDLLLSMWNLIATVDESKPPAWARDVTGVDPVLSNIGHAATFTAQRRVAWSLCIA
jgi:hypothetical protein